MAQKSPRAADPDLVNGYPMPQNIEIKARILDFGALEKRAALLADSGPEVIFQDDTFFACPTGRLKLRDFGNGQGELIFYQRADESGPKPSYYRIAPANDPDALRQVLLEAYGSPGRVMKQRKLYLVGRTRIHLDQVQGLGDFMELEVVLDEGEKPEQGLADAQRLMKQLGIQSTSLIQGAYLDLLNAAL